MMIRSNIIKIKRYVDISFGLIMLYAVGVMVKNYLDQSRLPEGVCPISNNYTYMIVAIVLLILAFTASTVVDFLVKKYKKDEGENSESKS